VRNKLIASLASELLGPRDGPNEVLPRTPAFEYQVGVLVPRGAADTPDADADVATGAIEASEEDDPTETEAASLAGTPDPRSLPSAIGITFLLECDPDVAPEIRLCTTWGEYAQRENRQWQRTARYLATAPVTVALRTGRTRWTPASVMAHGRGVTNATGTGVKLNLFSRPAGARRWRVTAFLANVRPIAEGARVPAEDMMFQPEVRVVLEPGSRAIPSDGALKPLSDIAEDNSMRLLVRRHPILARGHLCAAVWRDIDPQQICAVPEVEAKRPSGPPFRWVDGEAVPTEIRDHFWTPDIRTELLPLLHVPAPDLDWPTHGAQPPELDAEALARAWEPSALRAALEPLADGYEQWIVEREAEQVPPDLAPAATANLSQCRDAVARLRESIDLLCANEQVRLAFAFACRAMALQHSWSRAAFRWRPFQLAFVLSVIPSIADATRRDREECDLLWMPTAAGKTEAYLGAIAFTIALRRLRADADRTGAGTTVISRYTLRLLTIQQFRRTLRVVTACEMLRVWGLATGVPVGWRPAGCGIADDWIWGSERIAVGLWVGGGVTPNRLYDRNIWDGRRQDVIHGAISILRGADNGRGEGEPAQVVTCPCCDELLAVPKSPGLAPGTHRMHLVCRAATAPVAPRPDALGVPGIVVRSAQVIPRTRPAGSDPRWVLRIEFQTDARLEPRAIDTWWERTLQPAFANPTLDAARASRPGYFPIGFEYAAANRDRIDTDFEILCPNPDCDLNHQQWAEGIPTSGMRGSNLEAPPDGMRWRPLPPVVRSDREWCLGSCIPIPAVTVDSQVYQRCPSVVVATVDKMARAAFEPCASALFGNVNAYHAIFGFYRQRIGPEIRQGAALGPDGHPSPRSDGRGAGGVSLFVTFGGFAPPELILQDELHLIEGPLGSMVGIFETAVDHLASGDHGPCKYIASTATVRRAEDQVASVFLRRLRVFPPPGLDLLDSFFAVTRPRHGLDTGGSGRVYMGVCAPGRGGQTPLVRVWSTLLQEVHEARSGGVPDADIDAYWTLTGYFNALRELAGASQLFHDDIPDRIDRLIADGRAVHGRRPLRGRSVELSGQTDSTMLPSILQDLNRTLPDAIDAMLTTSMFGVGMDVPRLGLFIVHGQPKRTSDYIQATGRIGRQSPGLVVTLYRASRPRDLSHYEFFAGYHGALHRYVEPVTVFPFAPGTRERAAGAAGVALLRCGRQILQAIVDGRWATDPSVITSLGVGAAELRALVRLFRERADRQPDSRRQDPVVVETEILAGIDAWASVARRRGATFRYWEFAPDREPEHDVVLGDAWHERRARDVVYRNAPSSLREVEETIAVDAG
jgi:hypothetical protein